MSIPLTEFFFKKKRNLKKFNNWDVLRGMVVGVANERNPRRCCVARLEGANNRKNGCSALTKCI